MTAPKQNIIIVRNQGMPLDLDLIKNIRVNRSAVERRTASMCARRSVKKDWQAAWLLKAITCIDLTALGGDDTPANVLRLCEKAKHPLREDLLDALDMKEHNIRVAAVCVYHNLIKSALKELSGSGIPIAAVSTGFPAGQITIEQKLFEIIKSVEAGAGEIDIVISRAHVLRADWNSLYKEVQLFRKACGEVHMKAILETGDLITLTNIAKASYVCMAAGADFIKTSTGKAAINATLPISLVMVRSIREYYETTGIKVGFKPAGGIQKAKQALDWLVLIKEELGNDWLSPQLFRYGASSLLGDIERQLEHFVTGRYSASYRHPLA